MDNKYTAYDRIIHIIEKLPEDKITEAIEIIQEDSFQDLLDFCVEQNCFTQAQATTLYDFTIVFDSLDDNYHEFDRQKLLTLYDAIGIPENMQAAIQGKFIKRKGIRMDVLFLYNKKIPRKIGEVRWIYINCANGSFLENEKFAGIRFPFINMFFLSCQNSYFS